jgi:tetratricopeptide (TPR) repeat protein
MLLTLLLSLQSVAGPVATPARAPATPAPAPTPTTTPEPPRFSECMDMATSDPSAGQAAAVKWNGEGGGMLAKQCLGVAYANQQRWSSAAGAFEEAARAGELARDARAANYWQQSGNAWLAAGNPAKARTALDAALSAGTLQGLSVGEAHLDRARALVAAGDLDSARSDLDSALIDAPKDPLAWLLSATLARRTNDLPRASHDIAEALRLSADDPSVHLEAGNIAAAVGDEADARTSWTRAVELDPGSPVAEAARKALAQFGATEK